MPARNFKLLNGAALLDGVSSNQGRTQLWGRAQQPRLSW